MWALVTGWRVFEEWGREKWCVGCIAASEKSYRRVGAKMFPRGEDGCPTVFCELATLSMAVGVVLC